VNEDAFNMSVRKFLKEVGVTSQREIEKAVSDAANAGRFKTAEKLDAKMTLEIPALGMKHVVDGHVDVG